MTKSNKGPLGEYARASAALEDAAGAMSYADRVEHVSVLCAANTISIALLVGVILLQVGEWYTEETLVKPLEEQITKDEQAAKATKAAKAAKAAPVTAEKKAQ